jgi:hypothetical protein
VSTQVPLQRVVPLGQTQAPPMQVPGPQSKPQLPQLWRSVSGLVQTPLQSSAGLGQRGTQAPPRHTVPPGQAFPHRPQLFGSNLRSAQVPLQSAKPAEQVQEALRQNALA